MNKKILLGSIIAVAILVLVSSSSAIDVKKDVGSVSRENLTTEPLDNNETEIISKIDGSCLSSSFYGIGVFFDVEISAGYDTWIQIIGITSVLPKQSYTVHFGKYVKTPIFIGYTFQVAPRAQTVHGIAIGDIEWR